MVKKIISPKPEYFYHSKNNSSQPSLIPKKIWVYWGGKNSPLVDICLESMKKNCIGFQIYHLTDDNYTNFLDEIPFPEDTLLAHKSDYYRLNLLYNYGGIWVDASTLIINDLNWILDLCSYDDCFMCYSDDCTFNKNLPIAENWIIAAPKKSKFIKNWLDEFSKSLFSDFKGDYYKINPVSLSVIQKIPDINYLRCYVACAKIMNEKYYNFNMVNSGSTGHFYNYNLKSKSILIAIVMCLYSSKKIFIPPFIKFTSSTRKWVEIFIKLRLYRKSSIIGKFLDSIP